MSVHRPLHIILDFDGTITTKDTIEPLIQSAIALRYPSIPSSQLNQTPAAEAWDNCTSRYLADLSAHYEKNGHFLRGGPAFTGPRGLEREKRSLDALWDVEQASVTRVGEAGIFKGISEESLREKGSAAASVGILEGIAIRKGFREFLEWVERREATKWGVVSVNWSRMWVRGVLDAALSRNQGEHGATVNSIDIMANDIDPTTGMIEGCKLDARSQTRTLLLTTADKHLAQGKMLSSFQTGPSSQSPITVYMGDSPTDLSPLLKADIGIIMLSPSSSPGALASLVNKCGYKFLPVSEYRELYMKDKDGKVPILLTANDFTEIMYSGLLQDREWDPSVFKRQLEETIPKN